MHDFLILECILRAGLLDCSRNENQIFSMLRLCQECSPKFPRLFDHHASAKFLNVPLCFIISWRRCHEFDFTRATVEKDFIAFSDLLA